MFAKILKSSFFEPALIFGLAACMFVIGAEIEAFEMLVEFMEGHEDWQLDEVFLAVVLMGSAGYIYAFRRQVEKRKEVLKRLNAESDLDWLSKHDHLTKLPNRHYLADFTHRMDTNADEDTDKQFGLISIDLDGFKKANDLMGHSGGDKLLQEVAVRIQSTSGVKLVFRLGGDEFLAITDLKQTSDTVVVAEQIHDAILLPFDIAKTINHIDASIGVSHYPNDATKLSEAIHCSDLAMYHAKRNRSNIVTEFKQSMIEESQLRSQLEQDLLEALANCEIKPHYQPLVDLENGDVRGFEALARWDRKGHGFVSPETFVRVAEDIGAITDLSDAILRQACLDAKQWPDHMTLSFNLSPRQLTDRLISLRLISILGDTGLPPHRLEVEITESALIQDMESASTVLEDLHTAGIRIALDDFGTGYSNLSQLSKLNFDRIKIDRSFINDFNKDNKQLKIVKTILALGEGLGMYTTAEGIEDVEQLAILKELGCNCGQGFYLGRPADAAKTHDLIKHLRDGNLPISRKRSA